VVDLFAQDLAEAVAYAKAKGAAGEAAHMSAIYGGIAGGLNQETEEFIEAVMSDMLDTQQSLPPVEG
jgi:sphinganine-1-phosphate aldolase